MPNRLKNIDFDSVSFQLNLREQLQSSGVNSLFSFDDFDRLTKLVGGKSTDKRKAYIELNGAGQIDPGFVEYTKKLVSIGVKNGCVVGLHLGARLNFLTDSLKVLQELEAEDPSIKNNVLLKIYSRVEKYDAVELEQILDKVIETGFPKENLRVGLEHILSLLYKGFTDQNYTEKSEQALAVYEDILTILKKKGITRISAPETRGLATDQSVVYAMTNLLLKVAEEKGVNINTIELHFHNDFGCADINTLTAVQSILDYNKETGSGVQPIVDIVVFGGERSGIAGRMSLTQFFGEQFCDQIEEIVFSMFDFRTKKQVCLENTQTAGTHIDLIWNKVCEILKFLCGEELSEALVSEVFEKYQNGDFELVDGLDLEVGDVLLSDMKVLISTASLLVYGESIKEVLTDYRLKDRVQDIPSLVPTINIKTPVQGKRNILFKLILEGFDIANRSDENRLDILNYLEEQMDYAIGNKKVLIENSRSLPLENITDQIVLDYKKTKLREVVNE